MEDLIRQPAAVLKQVCQFLEIDDRVDCTTEVITANQGKKHFEDTIRSRITAPLKSIPLVAATATMLPQGWRDQAYNFLQKTAYAKTVKQQYSPHPMRPETRQMLIEKFMEPNQALAAFLDRDLSHWNQ
jgi:predicted DCC family thiol-disulfide oxidoreductase YuxK